MNRKKILIISHDKVGKTMAGPGIRYHQMANILSNDFEVTLGSFHKGYIKKVEDSLYETAYIPSNGFESYFTKADIIIAMWLNEEMVRFAKEKNSLIVFDIYAPVPVEDLVQRVFAKRTGPDSDYEYSEILKNYRFFIQNGDSFLCSNDYQKDFWLGYSFANQCALPSSYKEDRIDDRFLLSPMGINPDELSSPAYKKDLLSKRISAKKDDFVILWTGGIWDWFDALTPIKAVKQVVNSGNSNVKLVFLGTKHPNDDVPAMEELKLAYNLSEKIGLLNKNVFFLEGWIPYGDRLSYFNRADLALYAHKPSIEARFSHRTRVLDHILTSTPTLATKGDYFAEYMDLHNMGAVVEPEDPEEMAKAIKHLLNSSKSIESMQKSIDKKKHEFYWDNVLAPLVDFIKNAEGIHPRPFVPKTNSTTVKTKGVSVLKKYAPKSLKKIYKTIRGNSL